MTCAFKKLKKTERNRNAFYWILLGKSVNFWSHRISNIVTNSANRLSCMRSARTGGNALRQISILYFVVLLLSCDAQGLQVAVLKCFYSLEQRIFRALKSQRLGDSMLKHGEVFRWSLMSQKDRKGYNSGSVWKISTYWES